MRRLYAAAVLACALALAGTAANAKPRHARHDSAAATHCIMDNNGRQTCQGAEYRTTEVARVSAGSSDATIIGGRPDGCPHAYCGCGLRKYLGLDDARLNLAWNWAVLFQRESVPRAYLAAVKPHHVMYIEAAAGDGLWLVRDYNSGGGLSRLHVRDVRGYVFVNPNARVAVR